MQRSSGVTYKDCVVDSRDLKVRVFYFILKYLTSKEKIKKGRWKCKRTMREGHSVWGARDKNKKKKRVETWDEVNQSSSCMNVFFLFFLLQLLTSTQTFCTLVCIQDHFQPAKENVCNDCKFALSKKKKVFLKILITFI